MMNANSADECEPEAMLNGSVSEADRYGLTPTSDAELRLIRIAQYQREALRKGDPLRASLGAVNAGLLEIALQYEKAIKKSLQTGAGDILESPHLQRGLSTHLNITRQVSRNANFDVRMEEIERKNETSKGRCRSATMPATGEVSTQ